MRKILFFLGIIFLATPSWGFFGAVVQTAQSAKDAVYQKFMMLKAVQQLKSLRDNYQASRRYYAMYQRLNEGKGILPNVAHRVADIGLKTTQQAQAQFEDDWIYDKGYGSNVDQTMEKMDGYVSTRIRYAGKSFEQFIEARDTAEEIALNADSLDSKSTQKMILKTQALQMQLAAQASANLSQLLDVNTRLYRLQLEKKQSRMEDWDVFDKSIAILRNGKEDGRP